jgi:hypothetical protein
MTKTFAVYLFKVFAQLFAEKGKLVFTQTKKTMKNLETKSGGYFLELLPSEVQSKIIQNISLRSPEDVAEAILDIRDGEFINIADMIASSFDWDTSIEGRKYWEGIINDKYDGKDLKESIDIIFDSRKDSVQDIISEKMNEMLSDLFGTKIMQLAYEQDEISNNPSSFRTGSEYIKYLTAEEKEKFEANFIKIRDNISNYLDSRFYSFDDFIGSAFPFLSTAEGVQYWQKVRDKDIQEDLDEVLAQLNIAKQ